MLGYGAGLATGLAHFGDPLLLVPLLLVPALLHPGPVVAALSLGAAAGRLGGEAASIVERRSCRVRLPAGPLDLAVRVRDPLLDGGRGEARPIGAGCAGGIEVHWPAGSRLVPGATWRVRGRWIPREATFGRAAGLFLVREAVVGRGPPAGWVERLRGGAAGNVVQLYGARAPLVHALVLGRGQVGAELRDTFARSGLAHLLSISGFHVGLLAGWVALLVRIAGLGRTPAALLAALSAAAYTLFLGLPPPATRAAALVVLAAVERLRQRNPRPGALLAATGMVVLVADPWAITSVGAWLSFAAITGLIAGTRWSDRVLGPHVLPRAIATSVGATVFTSPITAFAFGSVAGAGLALNLVAVPLAALALPAVVASLVLARGLPILAQGFAAAAGAGLDALERLAAWGAAWPVGNVESMGGPRAALPWLLLAALIGWGLHRRLTGPEAARRAGWAACVLLLVPLLPRPSAYRPRELALHFLDVGQGDAIALRTPGGRWILVDAGPRDWRGDAGRRVVTPALRRGGARRLSALVVSHAHLDHLGGAEAVIRAFRPPLVVEPAALVPDRAYLDFLVAAGEDGRRWLPARAGQELELDGVVLRVLHPSPGWDGAGLDLNEDSVVLLVRYGCFRAVLTGDAGLPVEALLRGRIGPVALLKGGHHGSRGATGEAWLDELRPAEVVLSVGAGNRYGHPAPAMLGRLARRGIVPWRTDRNGTITARTDGRTLTLRAARGPRTSATRLQCSATPPSPPSSDSSSPRSATIPRPPGN
ncbi:MAG: DNA internalization-related competence protein ComEC/Rec2 [Gemmatimonadales bacterium]